MRKSISIGKRLREYFGIGYDEREMEILNEYSSEKSVRIYVYWYEKV